MGTRSLTVMQDSWENHEEIAVLYRQYDGYPEGHGLELADFLAEFETKNGYNPGDELKRVANGGDCLAAQIVAYFKTGVGSFYLHPAGTRNAGEEYIYIVTPATGKEINLKVIVVGRGKTPDKILYDGPASEFRRFWEETNAADN